jgi:hypothetical protein
MPSNSSTESPRAVREDPSSDSAGFLGGRGSLAAPRPIGSWRFPVGAGKKGGMGAGARGGADGGKGADAGGGVDGGRGRADAGGGADGGKGVDPGGNEEARGGAVGEPGTAAPGVVRAGTLGMTSVSFEAASLRSHARPVAPMRIAESAARRSQVTASRYAPRCHSTRAVCSAQATSSSSSSRGEGSSAGTSVMRSWFVA